MKDIIGQELKIGDKVACTSGAGYTYTLDVGEIVGFTNKKVRIQEMNTSFTRNVNSPPCLKFPEQVVSLGERGRPSKEV